MDKPIDPEKAGNARKNLRLLLDSPNEANRLMALQLLQSQPMHFDFFRPLWTLRNRKPTALQLLPEAAYCALVHQLFIACLAETGSPALLELLGGVAVAESNVWPLDRRPAHALFHDQRFFQALLHDEVLDANALAQLLSDDHTYLSSGLIAFLLRRNIPFDYNLLVNPDRPEAVLHRPLTRLLLELRDPAFPRAAFVAQFRKGDMLDFHGTGIYEIPDEALDYEGIQSIDLIGTSVKALPNPILRQIQSLHAGKRQRQKIFRAIYDRGIADSFFVKQVLQERGLRHYLKGAYIDAWKDLPFALEIAEDPVLGVSQCCLYLEACFETAMIVGEYEVAKLALRKLPTMMPRNLERQRQRGRRWPKWLAELILRGEVSAWLEIFEEFGDEHPFFVHGMDLAQNLIWVRMFEVLLFADRLADAVNLLALAPRFNDLLSDGLFAFERYFQHLYSRRQFEDMQLLLDCIYGPDSPFHYVRAGRFEIGFFSRIPFAELALHQGDRALAELNCSLAIMDVLRKLPYYGTMDRLPKIYAELKEEAEAAQNLLAEIYAVDRPICAQYFEGKPGFG